MLKNNVTKIKYDNMLLGAFPNSKVRVPGSPAMRGSPWVKASHLAPPPSYFLKTL